MSSTSNHTPSLKKIRKDVGNDKPNLNPSILHSATKDILGPEHLSKKLSVEDSLGAALNKINCHQWIEAENGLLEHLKKSPNDVIALKALITVYTATKNKNAHLITLLRLANYETLNDSYRQQFYALSSEIHLLSYSAYTIVGLIKILNYNDLNPRALSTNIGSYILCKYKLHQSNPNINLSEVFEDQLLLAALPVIRLCDPNVENLFTALREALLTLTLKNQSIPEKAPPIIIGLGLQYYLNEYMSYVKDSEVELLNQAVELLKIQMQKPDWTPFDSEAILLLVGMYRSFYELPNSEILLQTPLEHWPDNLQSLAKLTLFDIDQEMALSENIQSLTPIENEVSREVQAHYEQNPYPRWNTLRVQPLGTVDKLVLNTAPHMKGKLIEPFSDPTAPILIAGCGTGMQPIVAAKRFPRAQIIGIDISRRSLAYATIKKEEFGLENIDFYHGDILEAPKHLSKFHYIECSGVLHHMQNPKLGWQRLLDMLLPGGILKIAVYSSMARVDITAEREKIAKLKLEPTPQNIRLYRQALLNQKNRSPIVTMFSDFYSLSECRDLLFHQHEQCFTWDKVKEHCQSLNVKFLGIVNSAGVTQTYREQFPNEKNTASFSKLQELEKKHPYVFRSMYQFMVQKPIY